MSYIVEQKINGRIYLYEVENHWDKEKKQARQKRKYLGPKEKIYKKGNDVVQPEVIAAPITITKPIASNFVSKSYGDVFLVDYLQKELGLTDLLKKEFAEDYKELLSLSAFLLQESSASYLFPYWHEEHHMHDVKKLNSEGLSALYERVGRQERERFNFLKGWGQHVAPSSGIYYDITSVSSYSDTIESVEWGYNRDKESLPQINIGMTHCSKTALPLHYMIYPGSIVDVSTLKNTIKTFDLFDLKNLFFILDRGFCSVANIMQMAKEKMSFIQPLSFSLKKAKDLLHKHKSDICKPEYIFRYHEELLYHIEDKIDFEGTLFDAHIFYNEKAALDYKHYLYRAILALEDDIKKLPAFKNAQECGHYVANNLPCKYKKYFQISGQLIVRNQQEIDDVIMQAGSFIFVVHGQKPSELQIMQAYRERDSVEKDFNVLKNHLDGGRIRAHHQDTSNGRFFVKFIALIVHSRIMHVIKKDEKLKKYSFNEMMAELKKLKVNSFDKDNQFLTEISKKQKLIFDAFKINPQQINQF